MGATRTLRSMVRAEPWSTRTPVRSVVTSAHSEGVKPRIVRKTTKVIGVAYTHMITLSASIASKPRVAFLSAW